MEREQFLAKNKNFTKLCNWICVFLSKTMDIMHHSLAAALNDKNSNPMNLKKMLGQYTGFCKSLQLMTLNSTSANYLQKHIKAFFKTKATEKNQQKLNDLWMDYCKCIKEFLEAGESIVQALEFFTISGSYPTQGFSVNIETGDWTKSETKKTEYFIKAPRDILKEYNHVFNTAKNNAPSVQDLSPPKNGGDERDDRVERLSITGGSVEIGDEIFLSGVKTRYVILRDLTRLKNLTDYENSVELVKEIMVEPFLPEFARRAEWLSGLTAQFAELRRIMQEIADKTPVRIEFEELVVGGSEFSAQLKQLPEIIKRARNISISHLMECAAEQFKKLNAMQNPADVILELKEPYANSKPANIESLLEIVITAWSEVESLMTKEYTPPVGVYLDFDSLKAAFGAWVEYEYSVLEELEAIELAIMECEKKMAELISALKQSDNKESLVRQIINVNVIPVLMDVRFTELDAASKNVIDKGLQEAADLQKYKIYNNGIKKEDLRECISSLTTLGR